VPILQRWRPSYCLLISQLHFPASSFLPYFTLVGISLPRVALRCVALRDVAKPFHASYFTAALSLHHRTHHRILLPHRREPPIALAVRKPLNFILPKTESLSNHRLTVLRLVRERLDSMHEHELAYIIVIELLCSGLQFRI